MVETFEVGEMYGDCIGSQGIRRLQRWQKIGRDSLAFDCIGTALVRIPYRDSMRSRVMCGDFRGCRANEDCKGARSKARPQRAQRTYKDYFAFLDIVRLHRRAEQIETFQGSRPCARLQRV